MERGPELEDVGPAFVFSWVTLGGKLQLSETAFPLLRRGKLTVTAHGDNRYEKNQMGHNFC